MLVMETQRSKYLSPHQLSPITLWTNSHATKCCRRYHGKQNSDRWYIGLLIITFHFPLPTKEGGTGIALSLLRSGMEGGAGFQNRIHCKGRLTS